MPSQTWERHASQDKCFPVRVPPTTLPITMEQPRFGGVPPPPLSQHCGEGKSQGSNTETMASKNFDEYGLPPFRDDEHAEVGQKEWSLAARDPEVQNVMGVLQKLGISTHLERHRLRHERQRDAGSSDTDHEVYCKNLLLKDKKGQAYLVVCDENDTADLRVVKYHLNTQGNLYFASRDSLWTLLHVQPGGLTPLALIHPSGRAVRILVDASLVKRINRNVTKLFFHPLRPELQVGLTLSQLEKFLHYCGVTMETLPSLISYSAGRRYCTMRVDSRFRQVQDRPLSDNKDPEMSAKRTKDEDLKEEGKKASFEHTENPHEAMEQTELLLTQQRGLFQELGINVEVIPVPATGLHEASCGPLVSCQCIYLKDKRDTYFLFICHKNQKVDFSNLKKQLKPKKKITPLDSEELWSLLRLREDHKNPFSLAEVKQPRFLVAVADNLYQRDRAMLTFCHPFNCTLCLKVSLKDFETFVRGVNHDMITIPVKGTLESLEAFPASAVASGSPSTSTLSLTHAQHPEGEITHVTLTASGVGHLPLSDHKAVLAASPTKLGEKINLFHQMTAPLRAWISRCGRRITQLLQHFLPSWILVMPLRQSSLRMLMFGQDVENTTDSQCEPQFILREDLLRTETEGRKVQEAKISKLRQLLKTCEIPVKMFKTLQQPGGLEDNTERCKTHLVQDGLGRPYFILCTEDDDPTQQNLRQLRTAFRSRSTLNFTTDEDISRLLSWKDGETIMSWTLEELNPLVMLDLDLKTLGRVKVGITGAMYSFPDTLLAFHLPPLGVTLCMSCDDMERMTKRLGLSVVYLP